ncbi:MAG: hypothetical protein Q9211_000390 [Gyalolechia sp. 1 TL-2023]
MYDPDLIACLYPVEGQGVWGATETIEHRLNHSRFAPPRPRGKLLKPVPENKERSESEETEIPEQMDDCERWPCLMLRFSNPPKTHQGLVAGRSPQADIVLPDSIGVSWYHFTLTFDEQKLLIIRDLNSTVGTRVIYDSEEGKPGHGVDWSARGPGLTKGKAPVIKVIDELQFKIVVANHDVTSQIYLDNVAQFLRGAAATDDLFSDLKIKSRMRTELPTPACASHTRPAQIPGPTLWKKQLGRGSFGVVTYAWDVTSREEYALKEPLLETGGGDWETEAAIMKFISHDHILALKHAIFDVRPQLYFEYVPGGSLDAYRATTAFQRRQIAIQLLDGLKYLHGKTPPIAHRDIKPANVLVQHWSPDRVHVKLADFGLSKQSHHLRTLCGTLPYAAPEIYCMQLVPSKDASKYDPLVDIWSLSVLLVKLECDGLPEYFEHYKDSGAAWGEAMVGSVSNYLIGHEANDLLSFLLEDMLVVDPKQRQPAEKCHDKALRLFGHETPALTPDQLFSIETTDAARPSSDGARPSSEVGDDSREESDPARPRALAANSTFAPPDSGASDATTIRQCPREGEHNSQRSGLSDSRVSLGSASLIDALPPRTSVVDGELGKAKAATEAAVLVAGLEPSEDGQRVTDSDLAGSRLPVAVNRSLVNAVREEGADAIGVGRPSQRKRPRSEGDQDSRTASFSSKSADQDLEDGVSKRSKVWTTD